MSPQAPSSSSNASSAARLRLQAAMIQAQVGLPTEAPASTGTSPLFRSLLDSSLAKSISSLDGLGVPLPASGNGLPASPLGPALKTGSTSSLADSFPPSLAFAPKGALGVVRPVLQADVNEYGGPAEARTWGGSSCSAASLTAVLRSLGSQAKVGDVVRALQSAGGITVGQGLVSRPALLGVARRFGLDAQDRAMTYDQLSRTTSSGPVLVDVKNARFPEGHWMVATGADASGVSLVDSSGFQITRMSRAEFQAAWSGRGVTFGPSSTTAPQEAARA